MKMSSRGVGNKMGLYKMYLYVIGKIRKSRKIHRLLFKFTPLAETYSHGGYWDWTTLILRKTLKKHLKYSNSLLDMGTGNVGVLAIFSSVYLKCRSVVAVDLLPQIISSAEMNSKKLNIDIKFICCDLFANVEGHFDMIIFNPPYVTTDTGNRSGIFNDKLAELRFSGGISGGDTILNFLIEAPNYMSDNGLVVFGVSHFHIKRPVVEKLISLSNLKLIETVESSLIPATAYVLKNK